MNIIKSITSIIIILIIAFFIQEFLSHKAILPFNYDHVVK
jgi:hypothetical protein